MIRLKYKIEFFSGGFIRYGINMRNFAHYKIDEVKMKNKNKDEGLCFKNWNYFLQTIENYPSGIKIEK